MIPTVTVASQREVYENLANAIVIRAVLDYVAILRQDRKIATDSISPAEHGREELESFFKSSYFEGLTDVNGPWLIRQVTKLVDEEKQGRRAIRPTAFSIF